MIRFVAGLFAVCTALSGSLAFGADADVEAFVAGFESNKSKFPHVKAKFEIRHGRAATLEDAVEGKLLDSVVGQGVWIYNATHKRCDIAYAPDVEKASTKVNANGTKEIGFLSAAGVLSNKGIMEYNPSLKSVNIRIPEAAFPRVGFSFWGMGFAGSADQFLMPYFLKAAAHRTPGFGLRTEAATTLFGRTVEVVVVLQNGAPMMKYWIDVERGFLPVRVETFDERGVPVTSLHVTESLECSGGRWIPKRGVGLLGKAPQGGLTVRELKLLECDADAPPTARDFEVELAPGTMVSNAVDQKYWRTPPDQRVRLSLDRALATAAAAATATTTDAPAPVAAAPAPWYEGKVVWLAVAVFTGVAFFVFAGARKRISMAA